MGTEFSVSGITQMNIPAGISRSIIEATNDALMMLNTNLATTTDEILGLGESLAAISGRIRNMQVEIPSNTDNQTVITNSRLQNFSPEGIPEQTKSSSDETAAHSEKKNDGHSMITDVLRLSEHALSFAETAGELTPGLKRIKQNIGAAGNLFEKASGIGNLLVAANDASTVAEGLAISEQLMVGAAGIAEAASTLGPWGVAAAAAITVVSTVAGAAKREEEQRKKARQERVKTAQSLQTFQVPDTQVPQYLDHIHRLAKSEQHAWKVEIFPEKENLKKYGRDAYDLIIPLPHQQADNLEAKRNLPPNLLKIDDNKLPVRQSYLQRTFDLRQRLSYAGQTKGMEGFNTVAAEALTAAKKYDRIHHTGTVNETETGIKEALLSLFHAANDGREVSGRYPNTSKRTIQRSVSPQQTEGARVINVNLNRPMIENFTINAQGSGDGINDFKHKVEQVLLEILNSANVVQ